MLCSIGQNADSGLASCAQFYASGNTIPVALRLVCHAMRVLPYADMLDAVIDTDDNLVLPAWLDIMGHIILMRC